MTHTQTFTAPTDFGQTQMVRNEKYMRMTYMCIHRYTINLFIALTLQSSACRPPGRPQNGIKYDVQATLAKHNTRFNRDAGCQFVPKYANARYLRGSPIAVISSQIWRDAKLYITDYIKINVHNQICTFVSLRRANA